MPLDVLLVHQVLSGDDSAFHRLMKKYQTAIYTFILSWVKNEADAEELTQDVFWKAYQNLYSLRQPSRFYPWLIKIAQNQCQDWKRKKHDSFPSMQEADFSSEIPPLEELVILREAISKVLEVVETLPEVEKNLLKERYLEDVSYKDLQTRHGLSYKGVAMRLFKAKRKVREKVEKMLSGIVAFPWRDAIEKLFLGGIEAVKVSATTKLVTVWTATLLILGGITVSVWHTKSPKQVQKSLATQSTQETPTKAFGHSFSKPKPFVTPVQKPSISPPVTASVEAEEPMDDADWESSLNSEEVLESAERQEKENDKLSERKILGLSVEEAHRKAAELKVKLEEILYTCVEIEEEIMSGVAVASKIPDKETKEREFERLRKLALEQVELKKKIMELEPRYVALAEDWEASKPGGWIYELKQKVHMGTFVIVE